MKKIYYAIFLNMISLAVMAQTSTQPAERLETTKPTTSNQYASDGKKIDVTNQELLKPENTPVEKPDQTKAGNPVVQSLVDENSELLAKESHYEASKTQRMANGRRPIPVRISIGALMLSAKR